MLMDNEPTNIENKMFKTFVASKRRTSILNGLRKPFVYVKVYVIIAFCAIYSIILMSSRVFGCTDFIFF